MSPSFVSRGSDLDEEIVAKLLERAEEKPAKPWTIASEVADEVEEDPDEVHETLRQATLQGKLTPTADGDLRKVESSSD